MTLAYWCVLASVFLPFVWGWVAKFSSGFGFRDNHEPRAFLARLEGAAKRAHWAEQNTFESIPGFMAAVIIAHQLGAAQDKVDMLAVSYIVLRLVYGVLYISDQATLRSLVWTGALGCVVGIFLLAASA